MNNRKLLKLVKQWQKRTSRENYYQNVQWLEQHVVALNQINVNALPWLFSRLPCSSGEIFESQMIQIFSLKDMVSVNESELLELPQLLHFKNNFPRMISGRHALNSVLYQMLPEQKMVHLTLLKEPVKRILACYNHQATEDYRNKNRSISQLKFESLFNKKEIKEMSNAQAKLLAGKVTSKDKMSDNELYFYAKYSLDNCFSLVGVTEFYKEFLSLLGQTSGVKLTTIASERSQQTKVLLTDIIRQQIEQIKSDNKVDIQLYEYARSKFLNLLETRPKRNNVVSFFKESNHYI